MALSLGVGLDYLGVGFFAVSGAIAAAERRQDVITFLFFGALTGIGGGTLRDLLIGAPVFWVHQPGYLIVCAIAAVLVWIYRGPRPRMLLWMDAVGLSIYAVVGAHKAATFGLDAPVCVVMGVLTASFGGVLRDVLADQPSVLLRREIYVSAAIMAATVYMTMERLGTPHGLAATCGVAAGFVLRAGAIAAGWRLPQYQPGSGASGPAPR